MIYSLYNSNNKLLIKNLEKDDTFLKRFKGLLFKKHIEEDYGAWIIPCNNIHTFFMKFNIDIVYINKDKVVLKTVKDIPKNRISICFGAHSVIETLPGFIDKNNIKPGDKLVIKQYSENKNRN